jgi:hypothetical protein
MNSDFTSREGIDTWYIGEVETAVKEPLRAYLAANPNVHEIELKLSYGLVLGGLTTIRNKLYRVAKIQHPSHEISLDDILTEIRGIE